MVLKKPLRLCHVMKGMWGKMTFDRGEQEKKIIFPHIQFGIKAGRKGQVIWGSDD